MFCISLKKTSRKSLITGKEKAASFEVRVKMFIVLSKLPEFPEFDF